MGYFKRTRVSGKQLATDPPARLAWRRSRWRAGARQTQTLLSPALPLRGLARVLRALWELCVLCER